MATATRCGRRLPPSCSIEHEDSLMSGNEGLCKAIKFLQETLIFEDKGEMYWA